MESKSREGAASRRGKSVGTSRTNTDRSAKNAEKDPQKSALWEKEKQKLEKKYDAQRRALEKERKKIDGERKLVEKKRQRFLKEKYDNDQLKILLNAEKEIWLNRKRKNNDGNALLAQVSAKTKEWEAKHEEAKQEWEIIEKKRAEMKEQHDNIASQRETLKADWQQLEEDKKDFEAKSQTLVEITNGNEASKARLQELEDQLAESEKKLEERRTQYEAKDTLMKKREAIVQEKDTQLKKEGALMEDLKKNVYTTLEQRRAEFIKQSQELNKEISNWNSSFTELFSEVGPKVQRSEYTKLVEDGTNKSESSRDSFRGTSV